MILRRACPVNASEQGPTGLKTLGPPCHAQRQRAYSPFIIRTQAARQPVRIDDPPLMELARSDPWAILGGHTAHTAQQAVTTVVSGRAYTL